VESFRSIFYFVTSLAANCSLNFLIFLPLYLSFFLSRNLILRNRSPENLGDVDIFVCYIDMRDIIIYLS